MNRLIQYLYYVALVLGVILIWVLLWSRGSLNGMEQEAMRWRYLLRGERTSGAEIVYVDLDPYSIGAIGARPWDRLNFSQALHALLKYGEARAVGVDIIFAPAGGGSLLDTGRARAGDISLGKAVKEYSDRIVLASAYTGTTGNVFVPLIRDGMDNPRENSFPEAPTYPIVDWGVGRLGLANMDEALNQGVIPYWAVAFVEVEGELYSRHLIGGMQRQLVDVLEEPRVIANETNFILTDKDGWAPHSLPRYSSQVIYTLGLELFLAANELPASSVERTPTALIIHKDGEVFRKVPLVGAQSVEVNWYEAWDEQGQSPHYSFEDVRSNGIALAHAVKQGDMEMAKKLQSWFEAFKDKVVLLGPVDPQLKDIAPTPFNREPVPKVGFHANLYRTLHDGAYIQRASSQLSLCIIVLLTGLVTSLVLWSGRGRACTRIGSLLLVFVYAGLVFYAFSAFNLVLPLIAPVASAVTAALGLVLLKLGSEEWQRRRIKMLFGAYLSPELVNQMVNAQRDPELGGTEAELTSLFSDVEGFSALAEELPPQQLVALMNEYLGAMTDVIQQQGGTLDKYIGDAIVTMFGMPVPIDNHAAHACRAALRMQQRHAELRQEWAESGKWPEAISLMRTRIGLNTGNAVVGNMGSRVRFNYTMMGDSVNLAARCESGAKTYGVFTMVTDATLDAALADMPDLAHRKLDRIIVKGRSAPIEVFELWDATIDLEAAGKCRGYYEAGLTHYFAGDWAAALEELLQAEALEPFRSFAATTPSSVIAQRCREFLESGGPVDWNGVYRMETK